MLTILSPAKTLDFNTPPPLNTATTPAFLKDAATLMGALRSYDPPGLAELLNISGDLRDENAQRNRSWSLSGHTAFRDGRNETAKQALFAFQGAVYKNLAAEKLSRSDIDYAQDHIRILSGLYGYLRPLDVIQPYRLDIGTPLSPPRGASLYEFWSETITREIATELARHEHPILLNLASQEYFRAIRWKKVDFSVITPVFKERSGDRLRIVGVYAKQQRGRMARYIVENRIDTPEALRSYAIDGYTLDPDHSTDREWVFVR